MSETKHSGAKNSHDGQRAGILGLGTYAPARVMTNHELSTMVDTSDEWIFTRTGIRERRYAAENEFTSDMATAAARKALEEARLTPADLDYVLLATASPDNPFPSTAARVSHNLGMSDRGAVDIAAACSGFIYGLELAAALVNSGTYRHILVIGAEKLTSITNFTDRNTCVLFGDGAGAAVIGRGGHRIVNTRAACDFDYEALHIKTGCRHPLTVEAIQKHEHLLHMNGRDVYRFVVAKLATMAKESMDRAGMTAQDIDLFVPHQANINMLEFTRERTGIASERMVVNIDRYGNTSSASIPLALDQARSEGRVKAGDNVLLVGFGGGLTSAYALVKW